MMSMIGRDCSRRIAMKMPRHQRKVERHVKLVPLPEIRNEIGRPLIRLRQKHGAGEALVDHAANFAAEGVRLRKVLVRRSFALEKIGDGIDAKTIDAMVEPKGDDVEDRFLNGGIIEVEIGLMAEEAMPVILPGDRIPGPVGRIGVIEDDARAQVFLIGIAPDVEIPIGRIRIAARFLKPWMLIRRVIENQIGDDANAAACAACARASKSFTSPRAGWIW